jgi:RNase P/RNase MRP subunit p30
MRRTYADLHVCADLNNLEKTSGLVEKVSRLGYGTLAIPLNRTVDVQMQGVRTVCRDLRVDLVSRIDLRPRNPEELLRDLRKYRRQFEIVAVLCDSKPVARQAAKDRRVDLLNFPQIDFRRRFFDLAEAELASQRLASLEIDAKPLLTLEGADRIRLLSSLRRESATAVDFHVPIVLSSGVSEPIHVRTPMELAALPSMFGLTGNLAADAVSVNPSAIIKRNREKLSPKFVAPGIRLVRKRNDC